MYKKRRTQRVRLSAVRSKLDENTKGKVCHKRKLTDPGDFQVLNLDEIKSLYKSDSGYMARGGRNPFKAYNLEVYKSLKLISQMPRVSNCHIVPKLKNLHRKKEDLYKKSLVLDLDETLVSVSSNSERKVKPRPYANFCLEECSKLFEIIVFTASTKEHADPILNYLDPQGKFIQHRLYREDCVYNEGTYIKDLRIINRKLEDIVIVDNSVWSFASQINNGVPILPWNGDIFDTELRKLVKYLKKLHAVPDVREINKAVFRLEDYK